MAAKPTKPTKPTREDWLRFAAALAADSGPRRDPNREYFLGHCPHCGGDRYLWDGDKPPVVCPVCKGEGLYMHSTPRKDYSRPEYRPENLARSRAAARRPERS